MKEYWNKLPLIEKFKFILSTLVGILVVIFATLNWKDAKIDFIFEEYTVKLSVAIILSVIAGYLISFIFSYRKQLTSEHEIEKLNAKIERLSKQIKKDDDDSKKL